MNEVICHIGSYDVWAAFKLTWALFALNAVIFSAIGSVVLFFHRR